MIVNNRLIEAFESIKKENGFSTQLELSDYLGVSKSVMSKWLKEPGIKIRPSVWKKIAPKLEAHLTPVIYGNDSIYAELSVYEEEEDDAYIIASLAKELSELRDFVPPKFLLLSPDKKEDVKKLIKAISDLLD